MKHIPFQLAVLASLFSSLLLVGCARDEAEEPAPPVEADEPAEYSGLLTLGTFAGTYKYHAHIDGGAFGQDYDTTTYHQDTMVVESDGPGRRRITFNNGVTYLRADSSNGHYIEFLNVHVSFDSTGTDSAYFYNYEGGAMYAYTSFFRGGRIP